MVNKSSVKVSESQLEKEIKSFLKQYQINSSVYPHILSVFISNRGMRVPVLLTWVLSWSGWSSLRVHTVLFLQQDAGTVLLWLLNQVVLDQLV